MFRIKDGVTSSSKMVPRITPPTSLLRVKDPKRLADSADAVRVFSKNAKRTHHFIQLGFFNPFKPFITFPITSSAFFVTSVNVSCALSVASSA